MKTLENIKVGDWVKIQVSEVEEGRIFPIKISAGNGFDPISFTNDGKYYEGEKQVIFPLEEHEQPTFKERWMMVSHNQKSWFKRKVIVFKSGYYLAWSRASSDEEVKKSVLLDCWEYAKEIEEEQPKELNLEERVKILEDKLKNYDRLHKN
jgi:hypothetical protein